MRTYDDKKFDDKQKCLAAVFGLVVGDALGVPAEFKSRAYLKENPITDMVGYGTHLQPPGTWSDDSSMVAATMEWLGKGKDVEWNFHGLMEKFSNWLMHGAYTPYGEMFDCGGTTCRAIVNFGKGTEPLQCGSRSEHENGNGSLMRILPAALWCREELTGAEMGGRTFIFQMSELTHGHIRSKLGCLIFSKLIADMYYVQEEDKLESVKNSLSMCKKRLEFLLDEEGKAELKQFQRLWDVETFQKLPEDEIRSSGYVVDTLEAAIWCFLNTENYKDCVLKAVNLGSDTDTVAAVAGGLAGLFYGIEAIPKEWKECLPKREWLEELIVKMF